VVPPPETGIDWSSAQPVEIRLDEYAFTPNRITLRVGQPVLLRLVNTGARAHDFTAPGFFTTVATRPGDLAGETLRAARGSIDVPARGTREVAFVPISPGTWDLDCDKPFHGMFGMTGEITVLPVP
jgi:uncharacterized cupredoxin-like copper-binding protein